MLGPEISGESERRTSRLAGTNERLGLLVFSRVSRHERDFSRSVLGQECLRGGLRSRVKLKTLRTCTKGTRRTLSPIVLMLSDAGPMKIKPAATALSANAAFSLK